VYGALSSEDRALLASISPATIDRILRPRKAQLGKGKSLTRGGKLRREEIPILTDYWNNVQPGFMEADTVAHCGRSVQGPFVWTMTMTDIATSWTENRAVWTRNADNTIAAVRDIHAGLPFNLRGLIAITAGSF
jgi:hypothetical protein